MRHGSLAGRISHESETEAAHHRFIIDNSVDPFGRQRLETRMLRICPSIATSLRECALRRAPA